MELDRTSIEKNDFPTARRGYDPLAVDAHLREITHAIEDLKAQRPSSPLAEATKQKVATVIEAAERSATEMEREAEENARRMVAEAEREVESIRGEAEEQAREHLRRARVAVEQLIEESERLGGFVGELSGQIEEGMRRALGELGALHTRAGAVADVFDLEPIDEPPVLDEELLPLPDDFADEEEAPIELDLDEEEVSIEIEAEVEPGPATIPEPGPVRIPEPTPPQEPEPYPPTEPEPYPPGQPEPEPPREPEPQPTPTPAPDEPIAPEEPVATGEENGDGDEAAEGARLIALNMALNGSPREETDRYLAENFDLSDRDSVLDDVYSRVGG